MSSIFSMTFLKAQIHIFIDGILKIMVQLDFNLRTLYQYSQALPCLEKVVKTNYGLFSFENIK